MKQSFCRKKLKTALLPLIVFSSMAALWGAAQIEFVAELESVKFEGAGNAVLTVRLTPSVSVPVRVTPATEIKDRDDLRIPVEALSAGDTVKVEAFFTDQGILAREVELTEPARDFELKGRVQSVDLQNRILTLLDFPIEVPAGAEIQTLAGVPLSLSEIQPGDVVKVEGQVTDTALVARQIKVGIAAPPFARVRLQGTVREINGGQVLIELPGNQLALVLITQDTVVRGRLAVGVKVKVRGVLTPSLAVEAHEIEVVGVLELLPDEIHMAFDQVRRVDAVLDAAFAEDVELTLVSDDASIAFPVESSLIVPAGSLTASLQVRSGSREGTTLIRVILPAVVGGGEAALKVEVEVNEDDPSDDPDNPDDPIELFEVKWSPRKIESGGPGAREVRLVLNNPAPENLEVALTLKEGIPGMVTFPASVQIPRGERTVALEIVIHDVPVEAKIRARLPASVGGDSDTLDIELGQAQNAQLELQWVPDDLEMRPNSEAVVRLVLDQAAPFAADVTVSLKDGNASLVSGVPSLISFAAGQSSVSLTVRSGAASGKVRFQAKAPAEWGGDSDDLKIEIEE